jgi:hypothetical protein
MGAKDKNISEIGKALFHFFIHEKDLSLDPVQILGTFISGVSNYERCLKVPKDRPFSHTLDQKKKLNET